MMSHKAFELDVRLRGVEPAIWRTLEVPGSLSMEDVHFAIQVAMGWTNSHLHEFDIAGTHYGMVDVDEAAELEDERAYSLEDFVPSGSSFVYEYDFPSPSRKQKHRACLRGVFVSWWSQGGSNP